MRASIILSGIVALICCNAFSQSFDNNWVFADSAGLNFSSGEPVSFVSSSTGHEAFASISDSAGNLLFYTNGSRVWNRNHEMMPNGDSLLIAEPFMHFGSSMTQGVLILPWPGNEGLYFLFHIQTTGLRYSIVNMAADDANGDVIEKNILLLDFEIGEKMHAVKHGNGRDWWLIMGKRIEVEVGDDDFYDNIFTRFLISTDGLSGPFYQDYGPDMDENSTSSVGQMIFARDGNKMVFTREQELVLYDFDRCSGEFSNYTSIHVEDYTYGVSISPDATKIYVNNSVSNKLYQFCLNCDGIPVDSTKELVYEGPPGPYWMAQHLLGPDGKIYIATGYKFIPSDFFSSVNQNLNVINQPNEIFPLCDFDTNTVSLGERRVIGGLPNMPNYSLGVLTGSECDTLGTTTQNAEVTNGLNIYPNPADEYIYFSGSIPGNALINVSIFSIDGKLQLYIPEAHTNNGINISILPCGIYSIFFQTHQGMLYISKLVKF